MSHDYDRIFKENIEEIILPLARKVLGIPEPAGLIEVPDDLHRTIERRPDFLKIVTDADGKLVQILHIEIQTKDERDMVYRMLEYAGLLVRRYELPVKQFVLYIGPGQARMRSELAHTHLQFRFFVHNLSDIPFTEFLDSDKPEELVLAILANRGALPPEELIDRVLQRLVAISPKPIDAEKFLRQLEILSRLRDLQELTIERIENMAIHLDLETDIRYMQGERKGLIAGMKEGWREGRQDGLQEGRQEGRQEAQHELQFSVVKKLIQLGVLSDEQIATSTGVSIDFVKQARLLSSGSNS